MLFYVYVIIYLNMLIAYSLFILVVELEAIYSLAIQMPVQLDLI